MEENDHSIVRAVLSGDKEAYGALVVRHSPIVFRVAFRITGDEADAEEVVQETFLRGYQRLESFESRSQFGTWIYRIAVNCALNMMNKRNIEAAYQSPEETPPSQHHAQVADSSPGPHRLLLSAETEATQANASPSIPATTQTSCALEHITN